MKFTTTSEQQELLDTTAALFAREAGPERARSLGLNGHDDALLDRLVGGGYLDVALADGYGPVTGRLCRTW